MTFAPTLTLYSRGGLGRAKRLGELQARRGTVAGQQRRRKAQTDGRAVGCGGVVVGDRRSTGRAGWQRIFVDSATGPAARAPMVSPGMPIVPAGRGPVSTHEE